jgi:hypothetical protein
MFNNQSYLRIIEYLDMRQGKINSGLDMKTINLIRLRNNTGFYTDASGGTSKVEIPIVTKEKG